MMLVNLNLSILFVCFGVLIVHTNGQFIPKEFKNIKIENYLKNPRAVQFQLRCVIYNGPCDRIGKYLKITITEMLTNRCRSCSPDEKAQAGKLATYFQQNYPREWDDVIQKYVADKIVSRDEIRLYEEEYGVRLKPDKGAYVPTITLDEVGHILENVKEQRIERN